MGTGNSTVVKVNILMLKSRVFLSYHKERRAEGKCMRAAQTLDPVNINSENQRAESRGIAEGTMLHFASNHLRNFSTSLASFLSKNLM